MVTTKKSAIVSFVGKPNVGKSTLFNAILNHKWAIISKKPQTTRKQMTVLLEYDDENNLLLIDTPGYHKPRNKLDIFLNSEVKRTFNLADVVCFMYDMVRGFDQEDIDILKQIEDYKVESKILIINKAELSSQKKIDAVVEEMKVKYGFNDFIQISALHKINIDKLLLKLLEFTTHETDISFYKEPNEEFIVSEIIREKCLNLLRREIPYGIGVDVLNFKYEKEKNSLLIECNIVIEKESQKPIVVGKGARVIKQIGIDARKELLAIYDCKVTLKLFVKVKKDWRDSEFLINELGYKN